MLLRFSQMMSFGGRSNRGTWQNQFDVNYPGALGDDAVKVIAGGLLEAMRIVHLPDVHFMRTKVTPILPTGATRTKNNYRNIEHQLQGTRVVVGDPMPIEVALELKRETALGRSGLVIVRGALVRDDVIETADNSWVLSDPQNFHTGGAGADTMIERLNALSADYDFVIYDPKDSTKPTGRKVTNWRLGGVGFYQTTRRRRSIDEDDIRAAQRKLNEKGSALQRLARQIADGEWSGDILQTGIDIVQSAMILYMAISPAKRVKVLLPSIIRNPPFALPGS